MLPLHLQAVFSILAAATAVGFGSQYHGCWSTHSGVCVDYASGGCPFADGWFTWTQCPQKQYCCVPPSPKKLQRPPQGDCGRRFVGASSFVVGGAAAEPGVWPWLVQILKNGYHHCGGVLIRDDWVLTAAHCFAFGQPSDKYVLHVGHTLRNSSDKQTFEPKRIINHERFFRPLYSNDIALLQLNGSAQMNELVQKVCLPELAENFNNTVGTVAGWGATINETTSQYLRQVQLPIIPLEECKRLYPPSRPIYDQNICAAFKVGGRDACGGDSGGPLMFHRDGRWVTGGVVSHGDGCAVAGKPGVYAGVANFIGWIQGHLAGNATA